MKQAYFVGKLSYSFLLFVGGVITQSYAEESQRCAKEEKEKPKRSPTEERAQTANPAADGPTGSVFQTGKN